MNNFDYYNPTKIIFGAHRIAELANLIPADAKILITYGGQSAQKYGTLDDVKSALGQRDYIEFGGIEPNPQYETLMKAVALVKQHNINFLLAVGGGSVIDGTKFISIAALYDGDAWDMWSNKKPVNRALPLGCVLTIPATGSETNTRAVVSNDTLKMKVGYHHTLFYPQFAILDPTKSYTLPVRQVANGVVDAFIHVIEQYLTYPVYNKVQDRFAEGLLLTLIEEGPKALTEPENYDVRATIMWSATLALNGLIALGVPQDWATHRIGHQITALYGLDHAQTLAIVLPALLHVQRDSKRLKLLQFAERVWGITDGDEQEKIDRAIACTKAFFEQMGMVCLLSAYGIPESAIDDVTHSLEKMHHLPLGEHQDIDAIKVRRILSLCY
jgi:NADP-dependent alcohol dehydrogenase